MSKTTQQIKAEFLKKGVSIPAWSKANGFSSTVVYAVLYGANKGTRGEGHRIAVRLGLKAGTSISPDDIATAL